MSHSSLSLLSPRPILVTGGAGFIGSNFIHSWLSAGGASVINLDKLTYAGNLGNLVSLSDATRYSFVSGDIGNSSLVGSILNHHKPVAVLNFAAESHVDRSIHGPEPFVMTNIVGTFRLLESVRAYWSDLEDDMRRDFRFLHVSTDEVYGSLLEDMNAFCESSQFQPNSPYAASKASSDHMVRAWQHTYGLPVITTNCSNNYGPRQFPEKLIPLIIHNALAGKPLPIYGDGLHVRDWLYVEDHCTAISTVLLNGKVGETYNIGGSVEMQNIEVVKTICRVLDETIPVGLRPFRGPETDSRLASYNELTTFVKDRPGHDRRYAIDSGKIQRELGWRAVETFETGIRKTVQWYLDNPEWVTDVQSGAYRNWINRQYG
ncbi:dTDP-glucose 4,6-dehydratase [Afipia massiliensis]|uniref:dTDP-glucose 4,6-dehydratase n=1 Tax=Afipia massiliensis TaxID=211460 RepID=UPI000A40C960|nr:dTDP-glucose 4,6-dehydratase [Afipia massiliensis]